MSTQLGAISSVNGLISKIFTQPKGDLVSLLFLSILNFIFYKF